jgi:hypothetical protein
MFDASLAPLCVLLSLSFLEQQETATNGPIDVTLASLSREYVLGQPVLLTVTVRNVSEQTIEARKVYVEGYVEPEITVYTSKDGQSFDKYVMGGWNVYFFDRGPEILKPGASLRYDLRALYASNRSAHLAFHTPGRYWVKVCYPLNTHTPSGGSKQEAFDSNVVEITVDEPRNADAKLWGIVHEPPFLYFLQTGYVREENSRVPAEAVKLLLSVPDSSYHAGIKWALNTYYKKQIHAIGQRKAQEDPEMEAIREALGIPKDIGPFPEDERLDVEITYRFDDWTPLEKAFEEISRLSGVALRFAPELRVRRISGGTTRTKTLRQFMDEHDAYKAEWVPNGDGYMLVPAAAPAATPR